MRRDYQAALEHIGSRLFCMPLRYANRLSLLHVFKIFMIIFFNRQWDEFLHLLVEFAFFVFYER